MANLASPTIAGKVLVTGRKAVTAPNVSLIPNGLIINKDIGPGPKLVYSRLLTYAATNESATNNRIAADLAISPRSVRNYIAALKEAGLIEVRLHPGKPRSFRLAVAF